MKKNAKIQRSNQQEVKTAYDKIFKDGYDKTFTVTDEIKEILREDKWQGKDVVDVGCGTGLFAYIAAQKGANVLGLDYVPEAIAIARQNHKLPNLKYDVGDASELKGKYDIIVSVGTLEHLDDPFAVLKIFKSHLKVGGKIILTCPNWTNPRGYILQTLLRLFDAPITLTDIHSLSPVEFTAWVKKLKMDLKWRTFEHDWAHGEKLLADFKKRLPNVLRDAHLPNKQEKIDNFIDWLKVHVLPFNHKTAFSGALGLYVLTNKK